MPIEDTGDRDYYCTGDIECIDAIKAALGKVGFCDFLRGQVIKYNWRLFQKGGYEDSIKAAWYQNRLTQELKNEQSALRVRSDVDKITIDLRCTDCHAIVGDVHAPDCPVYKDAGDTGRSPRG